MLRWLFTDMDAYFAACEQQDRPELRGKPVGVLPVMSRSTCCIAASYEAKAMGVKTGTRAWEAEELCPGIVLVEARPAFYVETHKKILACVDQEAPVEKVYSIDEWSVRLAPIERPPEAARDLAFRIKARIAEGAGACLSCSIGIAPTRLLAKIASNINKPNGLTVIQDADLPGPLLSLKLTDLPGISTGMAARLNARGVHTVAQLWSLTRTQARGAWGSVEGERYWDGLHGIDTPQIATARKSFSHGKVLGSEHRTPAGAHAVMTRLLHKAAARLRAHGYMAHRLSVSIRYEAAQGPRVLGLGFEKAVQATKQDPSSFESWADSIDLPACQDTQSILEHFERLWQRRSFKAATPKKVSVTVSDLTPIASTTASLFENNNHRQTLAAAMDTINQKYKGHAIYFGGMHDVVKEDMPDKIAFGRVPDEKIEKVKM